MPTASPSPANAPGPGPPLRLTSADPGAAHPWRPAVDGGPSRPPAIIDPLTAAVAVLALLWKTKLNNAWLIAGGAVIGLPHALLT